MLYIPTVQKEAALIMKQAADLGIKAIPMGGDGWASPDLITLGGAAVKGSYFVNITSLEDPDIQGFIKDYRAKFGSDPVMPNPVMAIDALDVIIDAITKTGGLDSAKLTTQIEQTKGLQTLSGIFTDGPRHPQPAQQARRHPAGQGRQVYLRDKVRRPVGRNSGRGRRRPPPPSTI